MTTDIEPKSIQVFPRDAEMDEKVNTLAGQLRTSRAGLAALALEFAINALTSGKGRVVNGELVIEGRKAA